MAEGPTLQVTLVHGSRPAEKFSQLHYSRLQLGGGEGKGRESTGREEGVRERREGKKGSEGGCPTGWIADPRPSTTLTKLTSSMCPQVPSSSRRSHRPTPSHLEHERETGINLGQVGTYTYLIPIATIISWLGKVYSRSSAVSPRHTCGRVLSMVQLTFLVHQGYRARCRSSW